MRALKQTRTYLSALGLVVFLPTLQGRAQQNPPAPIWWSWWPTARRGTSRV